MGSQNSILTEETDCNGFKGGVNAADGVAASDVATVGQVPALSGQPTEIVEIIPNAEGQATGNSTRGDQANYDGATFILRRKTTFNRLLFRLTGVAGAVKMSFAIYQATNGGSGVAAKIATITDFAPTGTGNQSVAFTEGTVTLEAGIFYVLYGRSSAANSYTMRTWTTQASDQMTANVPANTHPPSFTTAIAATTSPATFDPTTPTGTAADVIPIIRLQKV